MEDPWRHVTGVLGQTRTCESGGVYPMSAVEISPRRWRWSRPEAGVKQAAASISPLGERSRRVRASATIQTCWTWSVDAPAAPCPTEARRHPPQALNCSSDLAYDLSECGLCSMHFLTTAFRQIVPRPHSHRHRASISPDAESARKSHDQARESSDTPSTEETHRTPRHAEDADRCLDGHIRQAQLHPLTWADWLASLSTHHTEAAAPGGLAGPSDRPLTRTTPHAPPRQTTPARSSVRGQPNPAGPASHGRGKPCLGRPGQVELEWRGSGSGVRGPRLDRRDPAKVRGIRPSALCAPHRRTHSRPCECGEAGISASRRCAVAWRAGLAAGWSWACPRQEEGLGGAMGRLGFVASRRCAGRRSCPHNASTRQPPLLHCAASRHRTHMHDAHLRSAGARRRMHGKAGKAGKSSLGCAIVRVEAVMMSGSAVGGAAFVG